MTTATQQFTRPLLQWFKHHGRKDLPWQQSISPYRVWVSEIMLQQTQVKTVIPYYLRFMQKFPQIQDLAMAPVDEVLHLWTGLGYYARARNLHRAAQLIQREFNGLFPLAFDDVLALPGIGRSTAGAILAISQDQPFAILDGNVKRVLSRFACIPGWYGKKAVADQLWDLAESYTPENQVADYTQAIMDMGATLCTRTRPDCPSCPVKNNCGAFKTNTIAEFPGRKPKKTLPVKEIQFVMLVDDEQNVMLEQRPPSGIWGGLWSFPECGQDIDIAKWCASTLSFQVRDLEKWPAQRHTFSHYHLNFTPVIAKVDGTMSAKISSAVMETGPRVWYNTDQPELLGLATPIKKLLDQLAQDRST